MSDIKYIIAGGDDDGEWTARFGCLAMVRFVVAAAMTVLTITVIALSIHAVLRSEEMGLSVNKGYIGADALWTKTVPPPPTSNKPVPAAPAAGGGGGGGGNHLPAPAAGNHGPGAAAAAVGGGGGGGGGNDHPGSYSNKVAQAATGAAAKLSRRRGLLVPLAPSETTTALFPGQEPVITSDETDIYGARTRSSVYHGGDRDEVTYDKVNRTNLRVILIANNPGGRTKIDCNDTHVSLIAMEPPYPAIGDVTLDNFTVPPQTTVTLFKRLNNTDTKYIWENHHLQSSFSVKVQVTSRVTSYPLGTKKGKTEHRNFTCSPITVGLLDYEDIYAGDHVQCTMATSSG